MDLQGKPIGSTNQGTKNTSDPERYSNATEEGPGAVASDSLAADSIREGGSFAQNHDAAPLGVSGTSSTLNNTDTSGATTLPPTSDADARGDDIPSDATGPGGAKYAEGLGGQPEFPGKHNPTDGYVGGPTKDKEALDSSNTYSTTTTSGGGSSSSSGNGDPAPSYVTADVTDRPVAGAGKPKGKNLQEVDSFDDVDESKNASFTSDIGSDNDPGRLAENKFQREAAESAGDAAGGPRQQEISGAQQYGALSTEESA